MSTPEGAGAAVAAVSPPPFARARSMMNDDRGAIMVLGIFMCSVIVGVLWYVAGIGDAIVYRERMQEASDAVAFSAATLNARGMNLIVLINLLMAVVLAVRVALKVLVLALRIISTILFIVCLIPWFGTWACAARFAVQTAANLVENVQKTLDPIIDEMLVALHMLSSDVIRRVVPPAAILGSSQVADNYKPAVTEGGGTCAELPGCLADPLPVEDGSLNMLCGKAGEAVGMVVKWPLSQIPLVGGKVGDFMADIVEKIVKAGGSYFCGFGGTAPNLDSILNDQVNDMCNQEKDGLFKDYQDKTSKWKNGWTDNVQVEGKPPPTGKKWWGCSTVSPPAECWAYPDFTVGGTMAGAPTMNVDDPSKLTSAQTSDLQSQFNDAKTAYDKWDKFNNGTCKTEKKQQLNQAAAQGQSTNSSSGGNKKPMKVKANWKNGTKDAQFLSLAKGDTKFLNPGERGVKVGAFKDRRQAAIDKPKQADFAFAQAEYFYDCVGKWDGDKCNNEKGSHEEAMWHFKWRARLRRFNSTNQVVLAPLRLAFGELGLQGLRAGRMAGGNLLRDPLGNLRLVGELGSSSVGSALDPKQSVFH
jgi:hypothetical protein